MTDTSARSQFRTANAFSLVELLVTMVVLTILMLALTHLIGSATFITTTDNQHMDADAQARPVLDRLALDIAQIVKRKDVDCFLKQPNNRQAGNDQFAFFSEVPGYYPSTGSQSPLSLIAYRVNANPSSPAYGKLERLSKGLLWNGVSAIDTPMIFLPLTIAGTWPAATSSTASEADYELIGPQVFRFEYFYLLKGQQGNPSISSDTPWDIRPPLNHTAVNGLQDLAALAVVVAVIDPKSKAVVSDAQIATLVGQMNDFAATLASPGDLVAQWQSAIQASTLPREASSGIRVYQRCFYLNATP